MGSAILAVSLLAAPASPAVHDVMDYGAAPGDGLDDTAEIQDAIDDAVRNGGGTVYLPNGVYDITGELTLGADGLQLVGEGMGSILSMASQGGQVLIVNGRRDIVVRDLRIGEKSPGPGSTGSAIRVVGNSRDILVENVRITGFGRSFEVDPSADARADRITLRDVWGEGGTDWGFEVFRADHVLFDNVVAKGFGNDGFKIGQGSSNWEIRGGRSTGNVGDGVDILGSGPGWRIIGTRFDANGVAGINVKTAVGDDRQEGSIIGVVSEENRGTGLDFYVGVGDALPHHITVQGGVFARNSKSGIRVMAGRSITLDGVIAYENDQAGIFVDDRAFDVDIVGAQVSVNGQSSANTFAGVVIEGDRVAMLGGTVDGKDQDAPTGGTATHKHGIFVTALASGVVIDGVAVRNAGSALVRDDAPDTIFSNVDGWKTRARGQVTLPRGTTSVKVVHGLAVTPELDEIRLSPITGWSGASSFWVSSPGAANFTIHVGAAPTADVGFAWEVDASGR
jgi:hypothetical protein